ncbi:family 78 glycoside hydrolase catalytic domain [Arcticibacter tournemirensis]|uniref:Alpha-L-rhamnosidase n=1 Tax=Arcticibacter tournemirensis TaxID=699437 RepID=A0A4Q0MBL0_9SPHI|nr:family 78 glycoside hydrolase catalytic domain [Arcticibacter tournemirensis]RXF70136.1 alpha-L-rhamnosidase [Arcticibacter tournemirensis]
MTKALLLIVSLFGIISIPSASGSEALDLSPAKWIWHPSGRTLQNTFILFRKEINIEKKVKTAKGWILADSRYLFLVNGKRVQWGPAPSDPRWQEADPLDLSAYLRPGRNIVACIVCFFGTGDGTYPIGKPGFLFNVNIDGRKVVSNSGWQTRVARSWRPGAYKRWFLRALQEEFDARAFPYGWDSLSYVPDNQWYSAQEVSAGGAESSVCNSSSEYQWEIFGDPAITEIRKRSIPLMEEKFIRAEKLSGSMTLKWTGSPEEYFEMLIPNAFHAYKSATIMQNVPGPEYKIQPVGRDAVLLTFEFNEQGVGWPSFTINAPEGTIIELLVHEAHTPGKAVLINSHFNSWTRFICKEGLNRFETFDFESFRWLQLHIRNFNRAVTVSEVGMRRRVFPWRNVPEIALSNDTLQKVMNATINTLNNCAQETLVDGMARERQQYSGDGSHQMQAVFQAFGENTLPYRFINTFSQGSSLDGYFMDSWPAWDRLARTIERQMQLTGWGPILDHSIGFCFDSYHYYQYTGNKEALNEVYPRLVKFFGYLQKLLIQKESLLPAENLGMCSVYIDHEAYRKQRHKQLALNLYASAMCVNALAPLCELFNDHTLAKKVSRFGNQLLEGCIRKFWSKRQRVFIANLPWIKEEKEIRYCDRSLATAVLYKQCPGGNFMNSLEILRDCPPQMGFSYPCNAIWRLWALSENGQMGTVISDLKNRWGKMSSVWQNNTLQEFWHADTDDGSQWSHCAVAPLLMLYQGVAGAVPLTPGGQLYRIKPQPASLSHAKFSIATNSGLLGFETTGLRGNRIIRITIPRGLDIELWLDHREIISQKSQKRVSRGWKKYRIRGDGRMLTLPLKYT